MRLRYTNKACKIVFGYEGLVATAYLTHDPDSLVPSFCPYLGFVCRESKQPLMSTDGPLGPARLWLTSSQGVLQAIMDYMSEVLFTCSLTAC